MVICHVAEVQLGELCQTTDVRKSFVGYSVVSELQFLEVRQRSKVICALVADVVEVEVKTLQGHQPRKMGDSCGSKVICS